MVELKRNYKILIIHSLFTLADFKISSQVTHVYRKRIYHLFLTNSHHLSTLSLLFQHLKSCPLSNTPGFNIKFVHFKNLMNAKDVLVLLSH